MSVFRLTAVPQKCVIQLSFITKSFNIFGEKFSCPVKYDGVTKCRIYLARAVDKLRAFGNTASLSSDYLKYGEFDMI